MISASLVLYNTPDELVDILLHSLENSSIRPQLHIIDNSPAPKPRAAFRKSWIRYTATGNNLGYGGGHNVALREILESSSFHFILNPDIRFDKAELEKMIAFAKSDASIGLIMPKIVYPDGTLQYLCKLIPTPGDLLLRRSPMPLLHHVLRQSMDRFEMRFTGYDRIMDVPVLSGCFMLLRVEALKDVGVFDERFAMYMEDFDLSRRIHERFRTVFYPDALVIHDHAKYSYRSLRGLQMHTRSAISYFNKWGWFFDPIRRETNRRILGELRASPVNEAVPVSAQPIRASGSYARRSFGSERSAHRHTRDGELAGR